MSEVEATVYGPLDFVQDAKRCIGGKMAFMETLRGPDGVHRVVRVYYGNKDGTLTVSMPEENA